MRAILVVLGLILGASPVSFGRAVKVFPMDRLFAISAKVLVGEVKALRATGITTELVYPTWNNVTFAWVDAEVEVIEPMKGTKKGERIHVYLLSTLWGEPRVNPPGMVEAKEGQRFLFCLLPTPEKGIFAAVTAPFDDRESVFLLDRSFRYYRNYKADPHVYDDFPEYRDRYAAIWQLVDDDGKINTAGAQKLRERYKNEIQTPHPTNAFVSLRWKKETSASGWQWNVPADKSATNAAASAGSPGSTKP